MALTPTTTLLARCSCKRIELKLVHKNICLIQDGLNQFPLHLWGRRQVANTVIVIFTIAHIFIVLTLTAVSFADVRILTSDF